MAQELTAPQEESEPTRDEPLVRKWSTRTTPAPAVSTLPPLAGQALIEAAVTAALRESVAKQITPLLEQSSPKR